MYRFILPAMLLCAGSAALSSDHGYAARAAARNKAELDTALAGLVPGKPQQCLDSREPYATQRIGDTILYTVSRRKIYRADTNGGCNGLDRGDAIVTEQFGSQLCAGDPIRTVDLTSRIPSGVCTIREFVPYTAPR
ncbi:hypothetical protein EWE75_21630 [Sphingomonas populi]|uniref:Uncharacterized protein n=1 Tax=Sphingomonas populi TaxID=2484750 RepID=A0A4Q6XVI7_9SPHN|nr:hypothetical protein [Sphingomonas populi]RZF60707.1 hypothetical protein EWE75_21630 [Sphingomonas populi]